MRRTIRNWVRPAAAFACAVGLAWTWLAGCGSLNGDSAYLLGSQIFRNGPFTGEPTTGGGGGGGSGAFGPGGSSAPLDPCDETLARKFVRISMRNLDPDDYIHYFVVFVAFVNSDQYPEGAVCTDDIELYTSFGYRLIPDGGTPLTFGSFCIQGPALYYFHRDGRFRGAGTGDDALSSAIGPAQGTGTPTYDNFFTSAGERVPVPNVILFHNPGGSSGGSLRVSRGDPQPCEGGTVIGSFDECTQDSFYYVAEDDIPAGSNQLGQGSNRRVPEEIQGTGCECFTTALLSQGEQSLLPPTIAVRNRACNQFARGGRIDYVFLRDDRNPPVPQLVWRVTDSSGSVIQDFDSRVDVP
ncbi:MAG: hypothetical protein HZB38_01925 [Planctomycetes bacterium]|nr:hypothetical protein [Planctomycetota bacterium]